MTDGTVKITLDYELARVARRHRVLVEPIVSASVVRFRSVGGAVSAGRGRLGAGVAIAGGYEFPAKLAWAVVVRLSQQGRDVQIKTGGRGSLPNPDLSELDPGSPAAHFLGRPAARVGGLLRLPSGENPASLAAGLIRAYPGRSVLVAGRNRGHASRLIDDLCRTGVGRPVISGRDYVARTPGGPKIVVTSLQHLDQAQPHDFDLVVVPDARPLAGSPAVLSDGEAPYRDYRLARTWWVPAFGFIPANLGLSPAERLTLGALFGPEAWLRDAPAVTVRSLRDPATAPGGLPDPRADPLGYRRRAVWENGPRTAWVAGIARAEAAATTGRVAVLAEDRHAPAVAAAVDWPVVAPGHEGPVPYRAVFTDAWAATQRPLAVAVLVDARGWKAVDAPGFPPRAARAVTLVDAGTTGPAGDRLAAGRRAEYQRRGWVVADELPQQVRAGQMGESPAACPPARPPSSLFDG
ncbi:MAG TPA: hypothetical protein VH092_14415 [Urbifossiella sp.]|jgi:hypothetical protein|nr:hypothetical protein [Urbifossiella sp.]